MTQCCSAVDNKDIYEAIPKVIHAVCDIKEVPETIHTLGAVVFVQTVEGPVLALLVPLLVRAPMSSLSSRPKITPLAHHSNTLPVALRHEKGVRRCDARCEILRAGARDCSLTRRCRCAPLCASRRCAGCVRRTRPSSGSAPRSSPTCPSSWSM